MVGKVEVSGGGKGGGLRVGKNGGLRAGRRGRLCTRPTCLVGFS